MSQGVLLLSEVFRHSPAGEPSLRIGVLMDDTTTLRCFAEVLEDIVHSNFAVIDCVIVHSRPPVAVTTNHNRLAKIVRRLANRTFRKKLLFDAYQRWDVRHQRADSPLSLVDCSPFFQNSTRIDVAPIEPGGVHRFPVGAVNAIRDRNLDVLLRFGFNILRGDILTAAKEGVWSFHHGDNDFYRGGPPMFWELFEENPLSGVILQRLTEDLDAGEVLCKSIFATLRTTSLEKSREGPYKATTHFVIRKLNELHRFGRAGLRAKAVAPAPYKGKRRLYRAPSNHDMLQWAGRIVKRRALRLFRPATAKHWRIAIRRGGPFLDSAAIGGQALDTKGFEWIDAPKGRMYADPFLFEDRGRHWLFAEDFDYAANRARISVAEMSGGTALTFEPCLELPYHLSFPFVFRHLNEIYLVPESAGGHEVTLYRASKFPSQWIRERVLLRGDYVDTVVWQDGPWWLLTTAREPAGYAVHSLLFTAHDLLGEWRLHPASPLFNDVRMARNGGTVFSREGRRYRVSQDGSGEYGAAFQFHEITKLTADEYAERLVARFDDKLAKNMIGTHTYTRAGEWEAIDGCFLEHLNRIT